MANMREHPWAVAIAILRATWKSNDKPDVERFGIDEMDEERMTFGVCSGVLITPTHVLTSSLCLSRHVFTIY